jgi:hypothetical protein
LPFLAAFIIINRVSTEQQPNHGIRYIDNIRKKSGKKKAAESKLKAAFVPPYQAIFQQKVL